MRLCRLASIVLALGIGFSTAYAQTDETAAYREAIALIRAGKLAEAQAKLLAADRSFGPATLRPTAPEHIEIVYASAIGSMLQQEFGKARTSLDRIRAARIKEREFVLNDAKVDLNIRNRYLNAVRTLDVYLTSAPSPDEGTINLLGTAIDKAGQSPANASALTAPEERLKTLNSQLEATRPGMRRWGSEWKSAGDYRGIEDQINGINRQIDQLKRNDLTPAQNRLIRVQADYDAETARQLQPRRERDQYGRDRPTMTPGRIGPNSYEGALTVAKANVQRHQERLTQLEGSFPKPTWSADLAPTLPESWSTQTTPPRNNAAAPQAAQGSLTLNGILTKMSDEAGPAAGSAWTRLNLDLGQKWLTSNAVGKTVTISAKYNSGALSPDGVVETASTGNAFTVGSLTIASLKVSAALAGTESTKAAKLVAGQAVQMSGKLESITMALENPNKVHVAARLTAVTLEP